MKNPFSISVYDGGFGWQGVIGAAKECRFDPKWNGSGVGAFRLSTRNPIRPLLEQSGARIRVEYRGGHLMSGPVRRVEGDFAPAGSVLYTVQDDARVVHNTLAWPVPEPGLYSSGELMPVNLSDDAQSVSSIFDVHTAGTAVGGGHYEFPVEVWSAESVIKDLVRKNFDRLGRNVTILPDLQRGGDVRGAGLMPEARFRPIDEMLKEVLDWSGLGIVAFHDGQSKTIQFDVVEGRTRSQVLTTTSGIVKSGKWSIQAPTATRVVVGGPGEDAARAFYGFTDEVLEADWSDIIEVFRDATGAKLTWPDGLDETLQVAKYYLLRDDVAATDKAIFLASLDKAARDALTDGQVLTSLSMELSETIGFHFGGPDGVRLGDILPIQHGGQMFTERLTGCSLTFSASGFKVVPQIGAHDDDPSKAQARAVYRLMVAQRRRASEK